MNMHNDHHSFQERIATEWLASLSWLGRASPSSGFYAIWKRTIADLFEAFPELTEEDVRTCLAYARAAVDHCSRPTTFGPVF
jgi:hypothetical protein